MENKKENRDTTNTSLVTDDLIMEIGRLNVEKLSFYKEQEQFVLIINQLKKENKELLEKTSFSDKSKEELQKSNNLFSENNEKLSQRIRELNRLNNQLSLEVDNLKKELDNLKAKPKRTTKRTAKSKEKK